MRKRIIVLAVCGCILLTVAGAALGFWFTQPVTPQKVKPAKTERVAKPKLDLTGWTDEQLREAVLDPKADWWTRRIGESNFDAVLCEIVRRGGPGWESFFQERLKPNEGVTSLEMLTVFRRVQRRPDPVQIAIDGPKEIEVNWPAQSQFKVALTHSDGEPTRIAYQAGGDYRSGRQERWRIEVQDERGSMIPVRERLSGTGGGILGGGVLNPGDTWDTTLDLASFITIPAPGTYTLQIQYHDALCISDRQDVSDLILCLSPKVKLTVKRPVVKVTAAIRQEVEDCLGLLDEESELKVIAGSYGEDYHDFIGPDTPQGRILKVGWPAVPQLVEDLQRWRASPKRKAWMLSLLYTITGLNDPRGGWTMNRALGSYSYREGTWQLWFGPNGETKGGGMGCGGSGSRSGSGISEEDQAELIGQWLEVLKNVDFQEGN